MQAKVSEMSGKFDSSHPLDEKSLSFFKKTFPKDLQLANYFRLKRPCREIRLQTDVVAEPGRRCLLKLDCGGKHDRF
jgi:hypothetical protein